MVDLSTFPRVATPPDERVRLPREALNAVEWLEGEAVRSVWSSGPAYLVISTLRCAVLVRGDGYHRPIGWSASAEYFFFNFTEPRVVGLSDVELSEEFLEGRTVRVAVRDPVALQTELVEARARGKEAWALRRLAEAPHFPVERPTYRESDDGGRFAPDPRAVKAPCRECGNLYETTALRCPACRSPRR